MRDRNLLIAELLSVILVMSSVVISIRFYGNKDFSFFEAIILVTSVIIMTWAVIGGAIIQSNQNQLPEIQAKKAEEFKKEYPEYAKRIGELIQDAFVQDDGGKLHESLEKLKILANKEKSLADLPRQVEKLKTEIAALEKELGVNF